MRLLRTRRDFLGAVSVGAVATAGCTGGGGTGRTVVDMTDNLEFDPASLTISTDETVVWENTGGASHTVTAYEAEIPAGAAYFASGGFSSEQAARDSPRDGLIGSDDSYEHTFGTTGSYEYFCIPHEGAGMVGSITVE